MLDVKFLRENSEKVRNGAASKNIDIEIEEVLRLDEEYRELSRVVQELYTKRNSLAKEKDIEGGREIKGEIDGNESKLKEVKNRLDELLLAIPALPAPDVKVGKDESENEVIKKVGEPTSFPFKPKDHIELGQILDIIDIDRAVKVSGARFAYLKNEGVLLEFALIRYAMDTLIKHGFTPVISPELIKIEAMKKLGYMENGGDEDMFRLKEDGLVLVGTAEHALVSMHMDELFNSTSLPKRYVGFSSSFRREAGSYGKDTKGILRVHQFDKVEMVAFTTEENDDAEHEFLLSLEENFFNELGIPYQVIKMCTGDLGFPVARKYDIEAWIPTQDKYRELTSASTTTDFQARRLNIKYQVGADKKYAHILNGTAFAIGRTLIAILENFQEEDGSVLVPEVLRKYTGFDKISPKV